MIRLLGSLKVNKFTLRRAGTKIFVKKFDVDITFVFRSEKAQLYSVI
jgi:hypothetical protein